MTASHEVPSRFFLPLVLLVPLALVLLPAPVVPRASFAEAVSLFDESEPPAVRSAAVPIRWRDDVFTGSSPSMPWSNDESYRRARVSRVQILEKRPARSPVYPRYKGKVPSFALVLLTHSLLLGRPPPPPVSHTG